MALIHDALMLPGFWLLVGVVFLAGVVRGFSGFGTAMIYLPFAATVLDPVLAVMTMFVFDLIGPVPLLPRMFRDSEKGDLLRLCLGAIIGIPIGLFVLLNLSPEPFRWMVSGFSLALVALLATGWRFRGHLSRPLVVATGTVGGLLGGICGLAGPPVIMVYMASTKPARVIRANIFIFLLMSDVLGLSLVALSGNLSLTPVVVGLLLAPPYMIGGELGARLFDPKYEVIYRRVAYMLIAGVALVNLPIWSL